MSNSSLSSQIKKDHLISSYDLFPVVLHELQEERIHHLCWSKKQGPNPERRDLPNFLLSALHSCQPRMTTCPVWPGWCSPQVQRLSSRNSIPSAVPSPLILPFPPTQKLQVDLIFHVSHWVSDSQSAQSHLRERNQAAEKQSALREGRKSRWIR